MGSDRIAILVGGAAGGHQNGHARALAAGLRRHGIEATIGGRADAGDLPRRVACWGWRTGEQLRERGHEVLVMERGYLGDRFAWTSLAWNGLNGRAEWPTPPDDNGYRFRMNFGEDMREWSPDGAYTLILGQVRGDASLQGRDLAGWYAEQSIRFRDAGPVAFRRHPESVRRKHHERIPPGVRQIGGNLQGSFAEARAVTTFNSNSAVDAILYGKPAFVADPGSMAWDMRADLHGTAEPPRGPWAAALAWRQWTIPEIERGDAWALVGRP